MNAFDLLVLVLLALALIAGARAGFFGPVVGLLGAIGGFALALVAASIVREPLGDVEQPTRAVLTLGALVAFVAVGEAIGAAAGSEMSRGLRSGAFRPLDMAGGAIVGAAHVVLLVWIVGGFMAMGMAPFLGPAARESVSIRLTAERLPPPDAVAGRIGELLGTTDLPELFAGFEPPPAAPVDLPDDPQVLALAQSAGDSTVRVTASGCGPGLSVGSGFFVGLEHVVTNAHVLAGSTATTVRLGDREIDAQVVAFDPRADLALLHVPGGGAPALRLNPGPPGRGVAGAVIGYPGGGAQTVTAAGVTASYEIVGPDIYGAGGHPHSVVELRADIRRGNSGGPLVIGPGTVGAVVFGASSSSPNVGYAIGADQAIESIGPYIGSTAPVGTGSCL